MAGFLDQVVSPEQVLATAQAEALRLSQLNMQAHQGTKLRVRGEVLAKLREGIEGEPLEPHAA